MKKFDKYTYNEIYNFNLIINTHNKLPNIVKIIWANCSYHYSVTIPRYSFIAVVLKSQLHIFKRKSYRIVIFFLKTFLSNLNVLSD